MMIEKYQKAKHKLRISIIPFALLIGLQMFIVDIAHAQQVSLTIGTGEGVPGTTEISVPITLTSASGAQPVSLQMDIDYDQNKLTATGTKKGQAVIDAQKNVSFSAPSSGRARFIVAGLNQNVLPDGVVAYVNFDITPSAPPGVIKLRAVEPIVSDAAGQSISANGVDGSISIESAEIKTTNPTTISPSPPTAINTTSTTTTLTTSTTTSSTITTSSTSTTTVPPASETASPRSADKSLVKFNVVVKDIKGDLPGGRGVAEELKKTLRDIAKLDVMELQQDPMEGVVTLKTMNGLAISVLPIEQIIPIANGGTKPMIFWNEDNGTVIVTTLSGFRISFSPSPKGIAEFIHVLENSGLEVNLVEIFEDHVEVKLSGSRVSLRPDFFVIESHRPVGFRINGEGNLIISYDGKVEQTFFPYIVNWAEFKDRVTKIPGVKRVQVSHDGIITASFEGRNFRLKPDFLFTQNPLSPKPGLQALSEDSIQITFSDGRQQITRMLDLAQGSGAPVAPNESLITARVLEHNIVDSSVLGIQPRQTLHELRIQIISSEDVGNKLNFLKGKEGEIIVVYSREEPPKEPVGKVIKGRVSFRGDERGGRYWIRDMVSVQPSAISGQLFRKS